MSLLGAEINTKEWVFRPFYIGLGILLVIGVAFGLVIFYVLNNMMLSLKKAYYIIVK